MISSYILPILCTATSVCHALYLQSSSVLSTTNLAYSSLQKKHHLRYTTHHHPSRTYNTLLSVSSTHRQPIPRISNKRCIIILNSALDNNNGQQQIENDADENEEHLVGIGVGIDLGTTNSAIAMMIPSNDNGNDDSDEDDSSRRRTVPTMLSIDENGSKTIPSVVSFIPSILDDEQSSKNESLPPWTTTTEQSPLNLQWPSQYTIQTGNSAIQYEVKYPKSTYRNVKRIIGTGGAMANLATGVVPNLYIDSINGGHGNNSGMNGSGISGGGNGELDILFNMLEDSDKSSKNKKNNNNKKKKQKNKWKKRKENELPKLHKQLTDAKDDPALLSCDMGSGEGSIVDGSGVVDSSEGESSQEGDTSEDKEILLRPEQISACILRHLYDTAEQYHRTSLNSNNKEVKVTRAVIGVPAYFTEAQRQATIQASEIAGVSKVKLLPEPEAAALAYGSSTSPNDMDGMMYDNEELILVFDLGGGTFDVSILEVGGGITEVMATIGNNRLGGTDFDKRVAEYLCSCAVDFDRKKKNDKRDDDSLDGIDDIDKRRRPTSSRKRIVKDWYRHGSGEVPDIILRVAEEVRKCLSNQKVVEVLVPLTEDGWKRLGDESISNLVIGPPIDKTSLETEYNMIENEDYTIISLDRTTFESICYNELQLLLQPIREVAIMAGVLLPGEARPSFVESAMLMAKEREEAMSLYNNDGEDFWDFDDDDFEDEPLIKSTNTKLDTAVSSKDEDTLNEQTMKQIQAMDIMSQKKAQQRGRKKARDIDKRERSFRKQKRSAMEEATTASLLGKQVDGGNNKRNRGGGGNSLSSSQSTSSVSVGNEKVQEGIHGRPLSRIVLVGGATRMPVIAKLLEAVVGMVPQRTVHPDEAVALGCAVQVGILDGENEGLLGGMQAVLSPMQAAVMRALAKKRGMEVDESGELTMDDDNGIGGNLEQMMMAGGISGMVVDEFDDEDDFY